MTNVLINGEVVTSDKVNPTVHKYLGMFRPPFDRAMEFSGMSYWSSDDHDGSKFWSKGGYDIPQYVTIK